MHDISVSGRKDILTAQLQKPNTTTTEGLESFFDAYEFPEKGLTVEEACNFYQLPLKKLKRRIRSGQIEAIKLGVADTTEDWRIFPDGIPQAFSAATRVPFLIPKVRHKSSDEKRTRQTKKATRRKEDFLAIEGELASLRCDVNAVDERLTNTLDTLSLVHYELDIMKQVIAQVGITTTWLNDQMLEVKLDRAMIERFPSEALISVTPSPALIQQSTTTAVAVVEDESTPKTKGWISAISRWFGRSR